MSHFQLLKTCPHTQARLGRYQTCHGEVDTPVFMPVGTQGTVKAMRTEELSAMGAQILLGNTYHLYLRPGHKTVARLGGLHRLMNWQQAILTDSGGYQVFSLAQHNKVELDGVRFQSHLDGSSHFLSPELAIEIQQDLGSDIMMVLDECLPYPSSRDRVAQSMELTLAWAQRCLQARRFERNHLFGIVQGGMELDLRLECAARLQEITLENPELGQPDSFEGFAIGGVSVGEPMELGYQVAEAVAPHLPVHKPRYLMGVGMPEDIITCIGYGIDMFDCVAPTRMARHGILFTSWGRVNIRNASFAEDARPIEEDCACYTCQHYSRAYLRHLSLSKEVLSAMLNTIHNLHYYLNLLGQARRALQFGEFADFQRKFFAKRKSGE